MVVSSPRSRSHPADRWRWGSRDWWRDESGMSFNYRTRPTLALDYYETWSENDVFFTKRLNNSWCFRVCVWTAQRKKFWQRLLDVYGNAQTLRPRAWNPLNTAWTKKPETELGTRIQFVPSLCRSDRAGDRFDAATLWALRFFFENALRFDCLFFSRQVTDKREIAHWQQYRGK